MARTAQEIEEAIAVKDMAEKATGEVVETVDSNEINSSEEDSVWGELEDEFQVEEGEEVTTEAEVVEEEVVPVVEEVAESENETPAADLEATKEEVENELPPTQDQAEEITEEPLDDGTSRYTPEEVQQMRVDAESEIAQRYQLSEEESEAMISEPETVLPKLAAKMYLDIYDGIMANLQQRLPAIIEQTTQATTARQQDTQDFYTAWPQLQQSSHGNLIKRLGVVYRQSNPKASKEQFISEVGAMAMVNLKLPSQETEEAVERQVPFTPAARSSAPQVQQAPKQGDDNIFSQLAAEFDEEDL